MVAALRTGSELGGYRIESLLWRTSGGSTFRARSAGDGQVVALEIADDVAPGRATRLEDLERASRRVRALDHRHIAAIHEVGEADGTVFVATRHADGLDLATLVDRLGALSFRRASTLLGQVADALEAAHAVGLVHGSLESARIQVTSQGGSDRALLTGFGFRTVMPPGYTAPERLRGGEASPAGDVYSLGCVLYEALAGTPPFGRHSTEATRTGHLRKPPPSVSAAAPELPTELDPVIAKALAKDAADRHASAGALGSATLAVEQDGGSIAPVRAEKEHVIGRWEKSIAAGAGGWSPSRPVLGPIEAPAADAENGDSPGPPPQPGPGAPPPDSPSKDRPPAPRTTAGEGTGSGGATAQAAGSPRHSPAKSILPGSGLRVAAVGIAVAGALALAVILLVSGDSETGGDPPRDRAAPVAPAAPERPAPAPAVAGWPDRSAYTVVIFVSDSDRRTARARARQAGDLGLRSGVLNSGDYPDLEPGLIVSFAGVFLSPQRADSTARLLRRRGIAAAPYVRFIDGGS